MSPAQFSEMMVALNKIVASSSDSHISSIFVPLILSLILGVAFFIVYQGGRRSS
jgi:hypothetical protein